MAAKLAVVWTIELAISPAVYALTTRLPSPRRDSVLKAQNELRTRLLGWACPEFGRRPA
jgi:hypothetical protein